MVLVENKVSDRRDRQIQEAIDVRNWKQALSLCEKRLKKGEKSDHLSVCLCYPVQFSRLHCSSKND